MKQFDEDYEKPSTHKQWHENASKPVNTKVMSTEEINTFHASLAASYKCNIKDITTQICKITDENDEDRDDSVWLRYILKTEDKGIINERNIFSIKIRVPEHLLRAADKYRATNTKPAARRVPTKRLPAPNK